MLTVDSLNTLANVVVCLNYMEHTHTVIHHVGILLSFMLMLRLLILTIPFQCRNLDNDPNVPLQQINRPQ